MSGESKRGEGRAGKSAPASDGGSDVTLYCDGACRGNPGPGGWGTILVSGGRERVLQGGAVRTTNNRMELSAAIAGLAALDRPSRVRIVTDSQYVMRGMTEWMQSWISRGWRTADKKPVLNQDLWQRLLHLAKTHDMHWEWIRGHAGHEFNERCDLLANDAIDRGMFHDSQTEAVS
jgi:ribonuclease HI